MNIETRLESLEKKHIRLRRITAAICLFGLSLLLAAATTPQSEIITAKAFVVLDNEGKIRQIFGPSLSKSRSTLGKKPLERYRKYINLADGNRNVGKSYGMEIFNRKGIVRAEFANTPRNRKKKKGRYNKDKTYIRLYEEEKNLASFMKPYFSVENNSLGGIELKLSDMDGQNASLKLGIHNAELSLSETRRKTCCKNYKEISTKIGTRDGLDISYGGKTLAGLRMTIWDTSKQPEMNFYIKDYLTTSELSFSMKQSIPMLAMKSRKQSRNKYNYELDAARKLLGYNRSDLPELRKQRGIIWKKYHSGGNRIILNSKYKKGPAIELWEDGVERIHLGNITLRRKDGSPLPRTAESIALFNEKRQAVKLIP